LRLGAAAAALAAGLIIGCASLRERERLDFRRPRHHLRGEDASAAAAPMALASTRTLNFSQFADRR
jgi:hypothetical protein